MYISIIVKISYNLLKEFLPQLDKNPRELAEELSRKLAEVESVSKIGNDYILEIENKALTHRPDCFSHWGIAREISAFYKAKLESIPQRKMPPKSISVNKNLEINIQTSSCLRYIGGVLSVEVRKSPGWLQQFLKSMDLRPVNNVVDLTNYVMLKYGQPMHAYDADKLNIKNGKLKISVRQAKSTESLTTIDGKTHPLETSMMIIADHKKPIAIAGIMGGKETEITNKTSTIMLESANFEMYSIRKASSKLGIRTDASTRFEKGQDPALAAAGFKQTAALLKKHAGAQLISEIVDIYPRPRKQKTIILDTKRVKTFLGINLSLKQIVEYLNSLQLDVDEGSSLKNRQPLIKITIPTFRSDLSIEEDLLEEIARLYGFNNIKRDLPLRKISPTPLNKTIYFRRKIKNILRALGFNEIYNYSFTNEKVVSAAGLKAKNYLKLKNPLSRDHTLLRQSLVPGLLEKTAANLKYFDSFSLFEIGKHIIPSPTDKLPREIEHLALLKAAKELTPLRLYASLKGEIERLFRELNLDKFYFVPLNNNKGYPFPKDGRFHNNLSQVQLITAQNSTWGQLGIISPTILKNFGIQDAAVAAAEINLETLLKLSRDQKLYRPVYPHPEVKQDISIILNQKIGLDKLLEKIKESGGQLLKEAEIFDVFLDPQKMKKNEKSVAIHLTFQSPKGSLSHARVTELVGRIGKMIEKDLGGKVRR